MKRIAAALPLVLVGILGSVAPALAMTLAAAVACPQGSECNRPMPVVEVFCGGCTSAGVADGPVAIDRVVLDVSAISDSLSQDYVIAISVTPATPAGPCLSPDCRSRIVFSRAFKSPLTRTLDFTFDPMTVDLRTSSLMVEFRPRGRPARHFTPHINTDFRLTAPAA